MLTTKIKWIAAIALLGAVITGCTANGDQSTDGEAGLDKQPQSEAPATATPEPAEQQPSGIQPEDTAELGGDADPSKPDEAAAEEPPVAEPAVELGVVTGEEVTITTMIEGMEEQVQVTEYTLLPYQLQYQMRTLMGEPILDNGQVQYKTQMGDDVATIALEVRKGTTVEQAAADLAEQFADGYQLVSEFDLTPEDEGYSYSGQGKSYYKDGYAAGFHIFDVNGNALIIHRDYPVEAGDGMAAVLGEVFKSLH